MYFVDRVISSFIISSLRVVNCQTPEIKSIAYLKELLPTSEILDLAIKRVKP